MPQCNVCFGFRDIPTYGVGFPHIWSGISLGLFRVVSRSFTRLDDRTCTGCQVHLLSREHVFEEPSRHMLRHMCRIILRDSPEVCCGIIPKVFCRSYRRATGHRRVCCGTWGTFHGRCRCVLRDGRRVYTGYRDVSSEFPEACSR